MIDRSDYIQLIRRNDALAAFLASDLDKPELASEIGVSSQTAYRVLSKFVDDGIIARTDDNSYALTPYGESVATTVIEYIEQINTLNDLQPLITSIPPDVEFDPSDFSETTVVHATPEEPLKPLQRFIDRFEAATSIKSFNKSFLEPMYIDLVIEKIECGIVTQLIYEPSVVETIQTHHSTVATLLNDAPNVQAYKLSELPFSLAIFDSHIGIGTHPEPLGTPISWVETDREEAISWGNQLFETYRTRAMEVWV